MIKGIIFDYGGTIDSRGNHWSWIIRDGWKNAGIDCPLDIFRECYVHAERELAKTRHILPGDDFHTLLVKKMRIELQYLADNYASRTEVKGFEAAQTEALARGIAQYCDQCARQCIEEARPVLEQLSARFPMMLVSNFYGNVDSVLRAYDMRRYFQGVIESAVVGVRKPDPRIFMLGVVALGLSPDEVVVVGDSLRKDILPARSIGCHTMWIKGHGWTADEDAQTDPAEVKNIAEALNAILTLRN